MIFLSCFRWRKLKNAFLLEIAFVWECDLKRHFSDITLPLPTNIYTVYNLSQYFHHFSIRIYEYNIKFRFALKKAHSLLAWKQWFLTISEVNFDLVSQSNNIHIIIKCWLSVGNVYHFLCNTSMMIPLIWQWMHIQALDCFQIRLQWSMMYRSYKVID